MNNPKIEILLQKLKNGESVINVEGGNSMSPKIKHREPVVLAAVHESDSLEKGDVVFFRSRGSYKTHMIWSIKREGNHNRFLITNIKGKHGVWVSGENIFGKVIAIGKQACSEFQKKNDKEEGKT